MGGGEGQGRAGLPTLLLLPPPSSPPPPSPPLFPSPPSFPSSSSSSSSHPPTPLPIILSLSSSPSSFISSSHASPYYLSPSPFLQSPPLPFPHLPQGALEILCTSGRFRAGIGKVPKCPRGTAGSGDRNRPSSQRTSTRRQTFSLKTSINMKSFAEVRVPPLEPWPSRCSAQLTAPVSWVKRAKRMVADFLAVDPFHILSRVSAKEGH